MSHSDIMSNPIQFVEADPNTLLLECIADYQSIANRTLGNADPEMLIINAFAYRYALFMAQVNNTGNQNLIAFATGAALDQLGIKSGTFRLSASAAVVTMQYTVGSGAGSFVIPAGNRVKSQDGLVMFGTINSTNITGPGVYNIDSQCLTTGALGNGYTAGTINVIVDPVAYVTVAANINTSTGGADQETDAALRARIPLASSTYSVAGPTDAYIYFAKSASASIVDVKIVPTLLNGGIGDSAVDAAGTGYNVGDISSIASGTFLATIQVLTVGTGGTVTNYIVLTRGHGYTTGTGKSTTALTGTGTGLTITVTSIIPIMTVCIYPLLEHGVIPDSALLDLVQTACNDTKVRPLTDSVQAIAPSNVNYTLVVELTLYKNAPANTVLTVESNLQAFTTNWSNGLGWDIIVSQVEAQCTIPGVYDVSIPSLSGNITILDSQFGNCTSISVTVVSVVNESYS